MKTFLDTNRKNGRKFRLFFLVYAIAMAVSVAANLFVTRLTGEMGQAAVDFDTAAILRLLGLITAISALRAIVSAVAALAVGRYSAKTGFGFRENFAAHFLRLPFSTLEKKNSGEMLSVFTNEVNHATQFVTRGTLELVSDIVSVVASFIFMLTLHWLFTLIFFGMFPVLIIIQMLVAQPIQKHQVDVLAKTAAFNAVVNDSLQNTSTVVAYSLAATMERRYMAAYDRYFAAFRQYILIMCRLVPTGIAATMAPTVFLHIAASASTINGNMTLAELIALISVGTMTGSWLMMLSQRMGDLGTLSAGAIRFNEVTADEHEDILAGADEIAATPDGEVLLKFENVSFAYDEENLALDGVSFEIKSGEKVAFVGGSGSGKSTALKLILGLYAPDSGEITIGGENFSAISKAALRRNFAYVPQDNFLFPESIGANISCVREDAPPDALINASEHAGILEFIENLPQKFDTVLTEAAENVSGGQRQRIAIARAFYQDAPVVLFDEATSSLDPITESQILETMQDLMRGRTVVMVAHRESAISSCDRVIRFEGGKIV